VLGGVPEPVSLLVVALLAVEGVEPKAAGVALEVEDVQLGVVCMGRCTYYYVGIPFLLVPCGFDGSSYRLVVPGSFVVGSRIHVPKG
jgi:hypothetical protein